jgi:tRNA dimethylallyltransferase
MHRPPLFIVAGPTASGKSAKAMEWAGQFPAQIINADSMQCYAALPLLTAAPSAEERDAVPHYLYGILSPATQWSMGEWLAQARLCIQQVWDAGETPIVVGGTGLYLHALMHGISAIPPVPDAIRAEVQSRYHAEGLAELLRFFYALDADAAAQVDAQNPQRVMRALEVRLATGISLPEWQKRHPPQPPFPHAEIRAELRMPDRATLYARCDARFSAMLEAGALAEVARLTASHPEWQRLPIRRVLGAVPLARHLAGECSLQEAIATAQRDTRHYAKRQMTWFRHQWVHRP